MPREVYRFFRLYGQHMPLAFKAVFAVSCTVEKWRCTVKGNPEELTVLYAGRRINCHYLRRVLFENCREVESKACNVFTFKKHADRMSGDADVTLLDLGWPYNNRFRRRGEYLEVPDWVNMTIDFPEKWDDLVAGFRRSARKHDLRLIRRNGYRCVAATTREEIETFYDEMYIPFVTRRHAEESLTAPKRHVVKRGLQGTLLHVLRGDDIVAAGVIYPERGIMFSLWMGLPRRHLDAQPEAAISALYYFGLRYAFERGYETFDFTGTRAFLNDGAYQFKRRWGPGLDDAFSPASVLIKPRKGNRKAVSFCEQVPVLHRGPEGLEAVFVRTTGPVDAATFARLEKDYGCAGFDRMTVIELTDENETRSMPNGAAGCQYRHVKTTLEDFSNNYVNH